MELKNKVKKENKESESNSISKSYKESDIKTWLAYLVPFSVAAGLGYFLGYIHQKKVLLPIDFYGSSFLFSTLGIICVLIVFIISFLIFLPTIHFFYIVSSLKQQKLSRPISYLICLAYPVGLVFVYTGVFFLFYEFPNKTTNILPHLLIILGGFSLFVVGFLIYLSEQGDWKERFLKAIGSFWFVFPGMSSYAFWLILIEKAFHKGFLFTVLIAAIGYIALSFLLLAMVQISENPTRVLGSVLAVVLSLTIMVSKIRNSLGELSLKLLRVGGGIEMCFELEEPVCNWPANKILRKAVVLRTNDRIYFESDNGLCVIPIKKIKEESFSKIFKVKSAQIRTKAKQKGSS